MGIALWCLAAPGGARCVEFINHQLVPWHVRFMYRHVLQQPSCKASEVHLGAVHCTPPLAELLRGELRTDLVGRMAVMWAGSNMDGAHRVSACRRVARPTGAQRPLSLPTACTFPLAQLPCMFYHVGYFLGGCRCNKKYDVLTFSPHFGANTTTATAKRLSRRIVP